MPSLYLKLVPLAVSLILFILAFRVHERFWTLGFSGWKKLYLGLAAIVLGTLSGVIFEFAEPRKWQEALGWPVDWALLGVLTSAGAALVFWSSVERLALAAREREDLRVRREAFELFESIRDAALGQYSFLEVLNFSLKEILRSVDGDAGGIWLAHPSRGDYIMACTSGFALPLQQTLEAVDRIHPGFSRLAVSDAPREITGADTLRHWFPELLAHGARYNSLLGVPLSTKRAGASRHESLGLLIICSRERTLLGQADLKLIGSAVAFLAATIAEGRAYRMVRGQRQLEQQRLAAEQDFAAWYQEWTRESNARRRVQAACAGMADRVGNFVGCARYISGDDRWEPIALAGTGSEQFLFGREDFRSAALAAVTSGKETSSQTADADSNPGVAERYRMLPIPDPSKPEQYRAVLFLPVADNLPLWWDRAIAMLVELLRVVLAVEHASAGGMATNRASIAAWAPDWSGLARLARENGVLRLDKLAESLGRLLPPGVRVAVWRSLPGDQRTCHLLMAAAADMSPVSYAPERAHTAPLADPAELDAHLGGLVRMLYSGPGSLTSVWPDFGAGWQGERVGFSPHAHRGGWATFYSRSAEPDHNPETLSFLQCLAGTIELLLVRTDQSSMTPVSVEQIGSATQTSTIETGESRASAEARQPLTSAEAPAHLPLDRALAKWIAAQPGHVRLGRMELAPELVTAPAIPVQTMDSLLTWAAGTLENGLPDTAHLAVGVQSEERQVCLIIERSDHATEGQENNSGYAAAIMPVDRIMRDTLAAWDGKCRVVYSALGMRKMIVSFSPGGKTPATALVIDDQELIRDLLLEMLDILGLHTAAAATLEDAWRRISAQQYAWIMCSSSVPGADHAFFLRLKRERPGCRVLLVTEQGQGPAREAGQGLIDGVLIKPFRIDDLRRLLAIPADPAMH